MQPIERVIIAIRQEETEDEVQLLETTAGISPVDLGEIMDWARALFLPTSIRQLDPLNLVFFMLPSGNAAIGQLVPQLPKVCVSSENNLTFYLKFIIASSDTFLAFGNNPTFVFQTALSAGQLQYSPNHLLAPIELCPTPPDQENNSYLVDSDLLKGLTVNPGARTMALLIQSALDSIVTYFTASSSPLHLIMGLFSLLPIHWRPELSFSVGLQFGGEHYLRIVAHHVRYKQSFEPDPNLPLLEIDQIIHQEDDYDLYEGWAQFVLLVLQNDSYSFFKDKILNDYQMRKHEDNISFDNILKTEEINESGFEWLYELQYLQTLAPDNGDNTKQKKEYPRLETDISYPNKMQAELEYEQPLTILSGKNVLFSPFQRLYAEFPERKADLQQLDALIAHVLKDDSNSIEILTKYWYIFSSQFSPEDLWIVRDEYIHFLQELLSCEKRFSDDSSIKKNLATLEILDLLLN